MGKRKTVLRRCRFLLLLLLLTLFVPGCGKKEPDSFLGMKDSERFLFVRKTNGENEIRLLNNLGEQVLSLKNYWVPHCIDEGREIKSTSYGIISENAVLVLAAGEGMDYEAGTFSVKEQNWIQEPLPGPVTTSQEQGKLHSISIGKKALDQNYQKLPFSDYEYQVPVGEMVWCYDNEGSVLEIRDGEGNPVKKLYGQSSILSYATGELSNILTGDIYAENREYAIADQRGEVYLDAAAFMNKNPELKGTDGRELYIFSRPCEDRMIVYYSVLEQNEEGFEILKRRSYLCDLSGQIIRKEWDYDQVDYEAVFMNPNWDYLKFWSDGETEKKNVHFMNASTGEVVEFPEEAKEYKYAGNGYFLMQKGSRYTIYDAVKKKTGVSFDIPDGLMSVSVYGLKSYLVSSAKEDSFCLNGDRIQIGKDFMFDGALSYTRSDGNTTLVFPKEMKGLARSYIFDRNGKVIFTSEEAVLWEERGYYLIEEGNSCTFLNSDKKSIMTLQ